MSAIARGRRLVGSVRPRGVSPRRVLAACNPGPKLRRRLVAAVLIAAVLGGAYMVWLRDSGLVGVDEVVVTGATGRDAEAVRAALQRSGGEMTTLHVRQDELHEAVAGFPTVRTLEVSPDFPHRLEIRVLERRPIALLDAGGKRIAVAGDGTLLEGISAKGDLPEIRTERQAGSERIDPGFARTAAAVAGGAPAAFTPRLERVVKSGEKGVVVELRDDGPQLIFGDATALRSKWDAALRVLADRDSAGASYVDLRVPGRPVAGGLAVETVDPVAAATEQDETVAPESSTAAPQAQGGGATATPVAPEPEALPAPAPTDPSTAAQAAPQTPAGADPTAQP